MSVRDARVEMRHPLVRSAILHEMSAGAHRSAHRALADALADDLRLDERAWHLAAAAVGPDAHAAEELERAGVRARRRSAHASAAAALERAAALSVDAASQGRRLVAAAAAAWHAGQPDRASLLLDRADPLVADRRVRADVEHLKGEIQLRCGVLLDACDTSWLERPTSLQSTCARRCRCCCRPAKRPVGPATRRARSTPGTAPRRSRGVTIGRAAFSPTCSWASAASMKARRRSGCRLSVMSSLGSTSSTSRAGSSGRRPGRKRSAMRRGRRSCCGARSRWHGRRAPWTS